MKLSVGIYLVGLVLVLTGMGSSSFGNGQFSVLIYISVLFLGAGMLVESKLESDETEEDLDT